MGAWSYIYVWGMNPAVDAIVGGVLLLCYTWHWFILLDEGKLLLDPMYEVQYECYLPIYGNGPEKCRVIRHQDIYGQTFFMEVYDSQGNLVGAWLTDKYGQIFSGWKVFQGKYVIYNPETGEWEEAPDGWRPGDPFPGQSPSSNGNQVTADSRAGDETSGDNNGRACPIM